MKTRYSIKNIPRNAIALSYQKVRIRRMLNEVPFSHI